MQGKLKILVVLLLALSTSACSTTYVPVSWGFGEQVRRNSRSDLFLATLFNRYDPERVTLRVSGASFDEVMMPSEVKYHLGAYRRDTRLIYRNLYQQYDEGQLRSLMLHELAHHVWYTGMTSQQRAQWQAHLAKHPSQYQLMVRRVYQPGSDYDTEDFAFTVEHARPVDIEALASINVITQEERDALMKERFPPVLPAAVQGAPLLLAADVDAAGSAANAKGVGPAK